MQELGIQSILALSPQAKGRIERLWGTFQNRLVGELRLAGASILEEANHLLGAFLPRFNARFGVPVAQAGPAYRQPLPALELESVLCFQYERMVAADNTVRFGGHTLQLLPGLERLSYAHARVEVQERLDGSLVVAYQGQILATREAPPGPVTLRARKGAQVCSPPLLGLGGSVSLVPPHLNGAQGSPAAGGSPAPEGAHPPAGTPRPRAKPSPTHPWRKPVLTKSLNT